MPSSRTAISSLLVSLLLSAPAAFGGELSAVLNGRSVHLNATEDWNENNFGFGVEYQFATATRWKTVLMANGFRDSSDEASFMAGGGLHRNLYASDVLQGLYIDAGLSAFFMSRRDIDGGRPFPGALPSLTLGNRFVGFNIAYLPRVAVEKLYDVHMIDDGISGIIYLQFKVNVLRLIGRR